MNMAVGTKLGKSKKIVSVWLNVAGDCPTITEILIS